MGTGAAVMQWHSLRGGMSCMWWARLTWWKRGRFQFIKVAQEDRYTRLLYTTRERLEFLLPPRSTGKPGRLVICGRQMLRRKRQPLAPELAAEGLGCASRPRSKSAISLQPGSRRLTSCHASCLQWGQSMYRFGFPAAFHRMPPSSQMERSCEHAGHFTIQARDSASTLFAHWDGSTARRNFWIVLMQTEIARHVIME
jgi:hypothetical protein